jgi:hypothetical protein
MACGLQNRKFDRIPKKSPVYENKSIDLRIYTVSRRLRGGTRKWGEYALDA